MAKDDSQTISVPYLLILLVLAAAILRLLFFSNSSGGTPPAGRHNPLNVLRAREAAVERIQQMFPQVERRTILWDLQRNGGNVQTTSERILAGRIETPPITFQPPPPAGAPATGSGSTNAARTGKAWSSDRDERQAALQRRRDDMILQARKKMEAKIAAEKAGAAPA
ncbi:hypothetical protein HYQ44_017189 [Verticillium longisporum]|nr:hypothetical protein HYQ44_017189 [Verticillium longisporum]